MEIFEVFLFAFRALKGRKVRSMLTILMVTVGTSLLIAVNGIGAGYTQFYTKQLNNLAPNVLFVSNSQPSAGDGPPPPVKITLNSVVVNRIKSLPFVEEVIPAFSSQIELISRGYSTTTNVFSYDPMKLRIINPIIEYEEGSTVRSNDPSGMIVSHDVANPPGKSTPFLSIGQTVRAVYSFIDADTGKPHEESKNYVVTAIIKSTGNPNYDNAVIININSGNSLLQKSNKFDALTVVTQKSEFVDTVEHQIRLSYGNNVGIVTPKALLATVTEFTSGSNSFLTSIALISLVVGAVGIATTLYTSVVERTREIGTMKAIGAQNNEILFLFIVEAMMIGLFGATLGMGSGVVGGYILSASFKSGPSITPIFVLGDMITVWLISVAVSLVSGLFPAWKASRTMPIEALRPQ